MMELWSCRMSFGAGFTPFVDEHTQLSKAKFRVTNSNFDRSQVQVVVYRVK